MSGWDSSLYFFLYGADLFAFVLMTLPYDALGCYVICALVIPGYPHLLTFLFVNCMCSFDFFLLEDIYKPRDLTFSIASRWLPWVKVSRINPELKILRLTFLKKSASKC